MAAATSLGTALLALWALGGASGYAVNPKYNCRFPEVDGISAWTAPVTHRIFPAEAVAADSCAGGALAVYAARNEFEPIQLALRPVSTTSAPVTVTVDGSDIDVAIFRGSTINLKITTDYMGSWREPTRPADFPDPLIPVDDGDDWSLTRGENTVVWVRLYVSENAVPGDVTGRIQVGNLVVPFNLHVWSFAVPRELHVKSQMNAGFESILSHYSVEGFGAEYWSYVNGFKQWMMDYRMMPKGPLWPGGLTSRGEPFLDYDCGTGVITDTFGVWGFDEGAQDWLVPGRASKWGDTGYPTYMAQGFVTNDPSQEQRPSTFCSVGRQASDFLGPSSTAYNQAWFKVNLAATCTITTVACLMQWIEAVRNYLNDRDLLGLSYYYIANEPQDQADYDAVAWYSQECKKVAPDYKIMVSEEPKAEIYDHPAYPGSKIDIWMAHYGLQFDPDVSADRLANHDEETWIYFLHGTEAPRFNPLTIDHPGIDARMMGWFLWHHRLRGFGYYQFNTWSPNPYSDPVSYDQNGNRFLMYPPSTDASPIPYGSNGHRFVPSMRLEMMREGLEDFEYFYLLNGGALPQPGVMNPADVLTRLIVGGRTAINRDDCHLMELRWALGRALSGEGGLSALPQPDTVHPRQDEAPTTWRINFQEPGGSPAGPAIGDDGFTYDIKAGVERWSDARGWGWIPDQNANLYERWDQWAYDDVWGSTVVDDWMREDIWVDHRQCASFARPSGRNLPFQTAATTLGCGWDGEVAQDSIGWKRRASFWSMNQLPAIGSIAPPNLRFWIDV